MEPGPPPWAGNAGVSPAGGDGSKGVALRYEKGVWVCKKALKLRQPAQCEGTGGPGKQTKPQHPATQGC